MTGPAKSAPPPDRPSAPAPPPPPRWRNWLLYVGVLITAALFLLPIGSSGKGEELTYTKLKSDISAGHVASVSIGPDGNISGKLTNGTGFTSSYPVNLQDPQFAQLLDQHHAQVTTQPAETSIWSVLLNFLPLLLIVGFFVWTGRAARRQLAGLGGLGGIGGIGRSRGKVFDTERPTTKLADVAGYDGVKREVTEVVDFLKHQPPRGAGSRVAAAGPLRPAVVVPLPTQRERTAILAVHSLDKPLGPDVHLDVVARGTPGFSGADLANLVNEPRSSPSAPSAT